MHLARTRLCMHLQMLTLEIVILIISCSIHVVIDSLAQMKCTSVATNFTNLWEQD